MIKLLLVHPGRMICELMAAVLRDEADIHVVGYVTTQKEALAEIDKGDCNTVLIDMSLPEEGALRLANTLCQKQEDIKVLITGLIESKTAILHCIETGIDGYILDSDSVADVVNKIRAVHHDKFHISPSVASALMARVAELKEALKELNGLHVDNVDELFTEITPREWEVLRLLEQCYTNQQIADALVIEKGTVKNHVHNILTKLDVTRREQAAILFRTMLPSTKKEDEATQESTSSDTGVPPRTISNLSLANINSYKNAAVPLTNGYQLEETH